MPAATMQLEVGLRLGAFQQAVILSWSACLYVADNCARAVVSSWLQYGCAISQGSVQFF